MRKGERSFITLEPKYGFRKVAFEKLGRYIEIDQINQDIIKEYEGNIEALFAKMKKTTLIYDIELVLFEKIYSLTDKRNLMKRIISNGKGITRPTRDSYIIFSLHIYCNEACIFANDRIECVLSSSLLNECERIILQSMKKKEKCYVDILNSYFNDSVHNSDGIINQTLKGNTITGRIKYEVELFEFHNNKSTIEFKEYQYTKTIISKGIGNISPWKDSLVMLACQLSINNELVYSNINKNQYDSFDAFANYIKGLKKEIKQKKNYDMNTQFIINEYFKEALFPIYDELEMNLFFVFRKDILQGMKPLTILKIEFTIPNDPKSIEDNYFRLGEYDISSEIAQNTASTKTLSILFNVCLINFEENVSVLNNKLITNKGEKISQYKAIANEFYSKGFIKTARKINKKLCNSYIKALNLGNKIQMNDEECIPEKKDKELFGKDTEDNMKKIMSNLIIILMKMDEFQSCEKYIEEFIQIFGKDEKVYYHKMRIHRKKGEYDKAIESLDILINIDPNNNQYKIDKNEVNVIIEQNSIKQVFLLKKMMKSL